MSAPAISQSAEGVADPSPAIMPPPDASDPVMEEPPEDVAADAPETVTFVMDHHHTAPAITVPIPAAAIIPNSSGPAKVSAAAPISSGSPAITPPSNPVPVAATPMVMVAASVAAEKVNVPATNGNSQPLIAAGPASATAAAAGAAAGVATAAALNEDGDDGTTEGTDFEELEDRKGSVSAVPIEQKTVAAIATAAAAMSPEAASERVKKLEHLRSKLQGDMDEMMNQFKDRMIRNVEEMAIQSQQFVAPVNAAAIPVPPKQELPAELEAEAGYLINSEHAKTFGFARKGQWMIKSLEWKEGSDMLTVTKDCEFDIVMKAQYPWKLIMNGSADARVERLTPTGMNTRNQRPQYDTYMHFMLRAGETLAFECANPSVGVSSAEASLILKQKARTNATTQNTPVETKIATAVVEEKTVDALSNGSNVAAPVAVAAIGKVATLTRPRVPTHQAISQPPAVVVMQQPKVTSPAGRTPPHHQSSPPATQVSRPHGIHSGAIPASVLPTNIVEWKGAVPPTERPAVAVKPAVVVQHRPNGTARPPTMAPVVATVRVPPRPTTMVKTSPAGAAAAAGAAAPGAGRPGGSMAMARAPPMVIRQPVATPPAATAAN